LEKDPARVDTIKKDIQAYLRNLDHLALSDKLIGRVGSSRPLVAGMGSFFYLVLGLPLFVFEFLNNYLPFKIPGWLATKISKNKVFYGAISISAGTFTFLIFYSVQIWLLLRTFHDWRIVLAYGLLLPLSGFFAFYYYKRFTTLRGNWKVFSLFYKKTRLITALISKRQSVIKELEKGRRDFVLHTVDQMKQAVNNDPKV